MDIAELKNERFLSEHQTPRRRPLPDRRPMRDRIERSRDDDGPRDFARRVEARHPFRLQSLLRQSQPLFGPIVSRPGNERGAERPATNQGRSRRARHHRHSRNSSGRRGGPGRGHSANSRVPLSPDRSAAGGGGDRARGPRQKPPVPPPPPPPPHPPKAQS